MTSHAVRTQLLHVHSCSVTGVLHMSQIPSSLQDLLVLSTYDCQCCMGTLTRASQTSLLSMLLTSKKMLKSSLETPDCPKSLPPGSSMHEQGNASRSLPSI